MSLISLFAGFSFILKSINESVKLLERFEYNADRDQ